MAVSSSSLVAVKLQTCAVPSFPTSSGLILRLCFMLTVVAATTNLFSDGQKGPLLGTAFGPSGANATFDYVVVGGGTAGLTLATRLAEAQSVSVAVVEAGGFYEVDNGNVSVVPGSATFFSGPDPTDFQPLIDWGFDTTLQPGANDRSLHYARGKTLGGSSARNYMFYQRGTKDYYQRWASAVGDESYAWEHFLLYLQRSAHFTPPNASLYINSTNHQNPASFSPTGGPLQVSSGNYVDAFGTWAQRALKAVGMAEIDGFTSGRVLGSAYATMTIDPRNGHRSSSEASFLQDALQKGFSPVIYKNTLAQRILFAANHTATGVSVTTAGTFGTPSVNFTLSARNEVVLSAGAFQSPQLLMVSGIGPCDHISQFNISCLRDLPGVGQNMWDHPIFGSSHRVNVITSSAAMDNATLAAAGAQAYVQGGSGPLSLFGAGYYGWEKLPEPYRSNVSDATRRALDTFPPDWPEIEWLPISAYRGSDFGPQAMDPHDGFNYAGLSTALVAPLSRGNVSLAGPDMTTPPVINPGWLTDPADQELAIQALKRQRQTWQYLADVGLADPKETYPGSNITSDADILESIGKGLSTVYHASATCKMGVASDPEAVVDSQARVYGVHSLRVVDASVFPLLVPGHPQGTVYGLAEKIAAQILADIGSGHADADADTNTLGRV